MKIQSISLDKLIAHPLNANQMSRLTFKKLVRNIERTGLYEPIVVRCHPKLKDSFEIINGHHRIKALKELGQKAANCVVWDVDDNQTAILLATLNRLTGNDLLAKKQQLLKTLRENFNSGELAKILPQTKKQIESLINLKVPDIPTKADERMFARPLVFFVTDEQLKVINRALLHAIELVSGKTSAERKAKALVMICDKFSIRSPSTKADN